MVSSRRTYQFVALCVVLAATAAVQAADADVFTPTVKEVTIFKDGHALILTEGAATPSAGWVRSEDVPMPVLGTFWTASSDRDVNVELVRARTLDATESQTCLSTEDLLRANVGKRVRITEQLTHPAPTEGSGTETYEATILQVPERKTEVEQQIGQPGYYDRYSGRHITPPPTVKITKTTTRSGSVLVKTGGGVRWVPIGSIRSLVFIDAEPNLSVENEKECREIAVRVSGKPDRLKKPVNITTIYLQRGIRWIPEYKIEFLADGKLKIVLQGTIINDIVDLDEANLHLVVGVPNFVMQDKMSPMALRELTVQLSGYFGGGVTGGGGFDYLSNVLMSQVDMPLAEAAARGGAAAAPPPIEVAGEQAADLYVYDVKGVSIKKGDRAVVKLIETTATYTDVYKWSGAPAPPPELWRYMDSDAQRNLAGIMATPKVQHVLRIKNESKVPWTTGPAILFKNGRVLGQELLTYTSQGNTVDLGVTAAVDVNVKKEDKETARKPNAISMGNTTFTDVLLTGTVTFTNFKKEAILLEAERVVFGEMTAASDDGKIIKINAMEDLPSVLPASLGAGGFAYWWPSWHRWPHWWAWVNPVSKVTWTATLKPGESKTFSCDWHYYFAP